MFNLDSSGLLLLGCGKMGSALLKGWLASDIRPESVTVIEPNPSQWLRSIRVSLNPDSPAVSPAVCVIAVKPQIFSQAVSTVANKVVGSTLILSIAAGIRIDSLNEVFGAEAPVIRAMPNTPASIGCGVSAIVGGINARDDHLNLAENLLSAVGETVRLKHEDQMDAVTALSGSGPAYVFHMIEAMAEAGTKQGLPPETAQKLAILTVAGAGCLAKESSKNPAQLRIDVTSPAGTTESALNVLMDRKSGLIDLMSRAMCAAVERSKELGNPNE